MLQALVARIRRAYAASKPRFGNMLLFNDERLFFGVSEVEQPLELMHSRSPEIIAAGATLLETHNEYGDVSEIVISMESLRLAFSGVDSVGTHTVTFPVGIDYQRILGALVQQIDGDGEISYSGEYLTASNVDASVDFTFTVDSVTTTGDVSFNALIWVALSNERTPKPILTPASPTAIEGTDVAITITNYDTGFTYSDIELVESNVTGSSAVRVGDTITLTCGDTTASGGSVQIGIKATDTVGGKTTSELGTTTVGIADAYAPTVGVFYAGTDGTLRNYVTRVNSDGSQVGSQTTAGTSRRFLAGAPCGSYAMFFGGDTGSTTNIVTRIDSDGALVGSQSNVGTARILATGAGVGGNGLFYAGSNGSDLNTVTRIDSTGAIVGSETNAGTARRLPAGTSIDGIGLFYGGVYDSTTTNRTTRIDSDGALIGSETNVGTGRHSLGGASAVGTGVFYAGYELLTTVTRIDSDGVQVGSETNVGTGRRLLAGATIGDYAVFYGGYGGGATNFNTITRIDSSGSLIGSETNAGTSRNGLAGAGI